MDFLTYIQTYNTEERCVILWKELREKHGVYCNRCGSRDHTWLPQRLRYRCKQCSRETTLRSGTVLEYSKLPFRYWVYAVAVLAFNMKSVSALQMQRYLGHPHYRPIWLMMQKMKVMMADRVDWYGMLDHLTAGRAGFEAVPEVLPDKPEKGNPGFRDKQRFQINEEGRRLAIMPVEIKGLNLRIPESHHWFGRASNGRLRLISMWPESFEDRPFCHHHPVTRLTTPSNRTELPVGMNIRIRSVDHRPRPWFKDDPDMGKVRFTEIMIVNARKNLEGIHHYVSWRYIRNYLGEYCYLTNRRYSGWQKIEQMFELFVSKAWNLPYIVDASD